MKRLISLLACLVLAISSYAQEVEMADTLRSDGKIYVVVTILVVILAGLIAYLVTIDRKVSRLEKKLHENKSK